MKDKETKITKKTPIWGSFSSNLRMIFGADKRSLALFRIFIAMTVIGDLINRASDLKAHYADSGVMPRSLVLSYFQNDLWITLHMISGLVIFQAILFFLHGIFAFCMMIGYYTKTMSILTWFFTLSLHNRNILVLHGGDILARQILFFCLFLPLGDCYSIDNAYFKPKRSNKKKLITPESYQTISVATFGIGIQLMLMYVTSYMHKTGLEWTTYRTSTWLALQLDFFRTGWGDFFLNFPELLKFLTAGVLWWEGYGPLFWYIPILTGPLRTFGVLGFFAMHFGFGLCLRLGQFAVTGMFGITSLLPTWFWEEVVFRKLRTKERIGFKLFYNPNSTLCTNIAIFIEHFLLIPESQVIPNLNKQDTGSFSAHDNSSLDSKKTDEDVERNMPQSPKNEFVVEVNTNRSYATTSSGWFVAQDYRGTYYTDFEAIVAMCRVSPLLWPLAHILPKKAIASRARRFYNRLQSFGAGKGPESQPVARLRSHQAEFIRKFSKIFFRVGSNFVCFFFLVFIISWNAGNVGYTRFATPQSIKWLAWFFHVDQSWMMFSPRPPSVQWSYIIDAEQDNGNKLELFGNEGIFYFEGRPATWEKPDPFWKSFKNHRWFKYYENGINTHPNNEQLRLNFGRYLCREFNARHSGGERLYKFSLYWMSERAEPNQPRSPLQKQNLWNHVCYDKPKQ